MSCCVHMACTAVMLLQLGIHDHIAVGHPRLEGTLDSPDTMSSLGFVDRTLCTVMLHTFLQLQWFAF